MREIKSHRRELCFQLNNKWYLPRVLQVLPYVRCRSHNLLEPPSCYPQMQKKVYSWYFHRLFSFSLHFVISKAGLIPLPFCSMSQANVGAFLFCHQAGLLVCFVFEICWPAVTSRCHKHRHFIGFMMGFATNDL